MIENQRLTWNEIVKKYPNQWVGLTDVERNGASVRSAVVKYTDKTGNELVGTQIKDKSIYGTYTTMDNIPFIYSTVHIKTKGAVNP